MGIYPVGTLFYWPVWEWGMGENTPRSGKGPAGQDGPKSKNFQMKEDNGL